MYENKRVPFKTLRKVYSARQSAYEYAKIFIFFAGLVVFLAGCQKSKPGLAKSETIIPTEKNIVVLLDKTASVKDQKGVFSSAVKKIIGSLEPGDRFRLAEITGSSAADFDFVLKTRIPKNPPYNVLETNEAEYKDTVNKLDQKRKLIRQKLLEQTKSELAKRPSAMQTDLFGAIYTASLYLSDKKGKKILVVLSDMIEENDHWRFNKVKWTPTLEKKILTREEKLGLVPNMHGIEVYVVGARGNSLEVMQNIRHFWEAYFKKAGATFTEDHYAHTLLDWSE